MRRNIQNFGINLFQLFKNPQILFKNEESSNLTSLKIPIPMEIHVMI